MLEGGLVVRTSQASASVIVALSQPLAMIGQGVAGSIGNATYGLLAEARANTSTQNTALVDRMWMSLLGRSGIAAAARLEASLGLAPGFHHLVDPGTVKHPATLIWEDFVMGSIALGVCGLAFGFAQHITPGDPSTLVGVGFKADSTHQLRAFVHDCPTNVAPVTIRRDTLIPGVFSNALHRLTIVIDGLTKTITWMIDRVVVDTWTPSAPLDQMTATGPLILWAASVPINGSATIWIHGGGIPQLRLLLR